MYLAGCHKFLQRFGRRMNWKYKDQISSEGVTGVTTLTRMTRVTRLTERQGLQDSELYWAVLGWLYWAALGCTGRYWNVVCCTRLYWGLLGCTGQYWDVMDCIEPYWAILGCTGLSRWFR